MRDNNNRTDNIINSNRSHYYSQNPYGYQNPGNARNLKSIKALKKSNRRKSVLIWVLIILLIAIAAATGYLGYTQYKKSKEPVNLYYSMTEEASARAYVWLSKIDDMNLSYDDVKECMGDFNLEVIKTPTDQKGVYSLSLAEKAYEYCENQAEVGLEKAYKKVVSDRITSSGYEGTITDDTVENLMMDTFGLSVSDYLKECNITLLPSEEEIIAKYSGEIEDEEK